jgi:hypothetical protein
MPEMIFVDSSNVEAIGYDTQSQELHVRFLKSGETYVYYAVEADPSAKPEAHVIWPCDPRGDKGGRNGWTKDTGQRGRAGVPEGGTGSAGAEPGAVGAAAGHRRAVARGVAQELSAPRQRRLG